MVTPTPDYAPASIAVSTPETLAASSVPTVSAPATPFSTGELHNTQCLNGASGNLYKGSVCLFDDAIHTLITVNDAGGQSFTHCALDLSALTPAPGSPGSNGGGALPTAWTDPRLFDPSVLQPDKWKRMGSVGGTRLPSRTQRSIGLTANSNSMHAIFAHSYVIPADRAEVVSRVYTPATQSGPAGWTENDLILNLPNGDALITYPNGGLCARFFGENQLIVAVTGRYADSTELSGFTLLLFDLADRDNTRGNWTARAATPVPWSDVIFYMDGQGLDLPNVGTSPTIDIDWFTSPPPAGNGDFLFHLAIAVTPADMPGNGGYGLTFTGTIPLPIDANGRIVSTGDPFQLLDKNFSTRGQGAESGLKRDPVGRLRALAGPTQGTGSPSDGEIASVIIGTSSAPTSNNDMNRWNWPSPQITAPGATATSLKPVGEFYVFQNAAIITRLTDTKSYTDIPILEFVLYGDGYYQVRLYGTIRLAQFADNPPLKDPEISVIGGYIDGPIPFPIANYIDSNLTIKQQEIGSFAYHSGTGDDVEKTSKTDWAFGIRADTKFSKGVGPAFDASLTVTTGNVSSTGVDSEVDRSLNVVGQIDTTDEQHPVITAHGAATLLTATINISKYMFYDSNGDYVEGYGDGPGAGPAAAGGQITMTAGSHPVFANFTPYVHVPGVLESYTPNGVPATGDWPAIDGMNQIMARLEKAAGRPVHDDYFQEVIHANGYQLGNGERFLPFTWASGNTAGGSYAEVDTSFTEQTYSFDSDLYAGVSGGGGVEFGGMGIEFEFSLMAGFDYTNDRSSSDLKSSSWRIEVEELWGPPLTTTTDDTVTGYTVRAYFLPPPADDPTYWAEELRAYVPAGSDLTAGMIDKGSGCWRVAFVVTDIIYLNKPPYSYEG